MTALVALTERSLRTTLRDAGILFEIFVPIVSLVGLTMATHGLIDTGHLTYPQYVLPAVVVQSMIMAAALTADRAGRDRVFGLGTRLRTMPIAAISPVSARITATLVRASIALVATMVAGYAFGFRMAGGLAYGVAFVVLALLLCLGVSLGADALGSRGGNIETTTQLMLIPQLLLILLSTGVAPEKTFPEWVRPFVRNQPVSHTAETLRGLASGHVPTHHAQVAMAWCVGMLLLFGLITLRMQRRSQ
ncbi:ABC transporter [Mycobacterium asiaticum]|uniref:Transport permease protein n=1 Tax=Mycobacterium asiaticum TaxID=1790 RepID=A0A1A3P147_MYCAS|nr:ABC transporter permease [Mycobacterium asiaticum]OBK26994.1 ABC transporter [Mycobacterium asiaticum]